MFKLIIAIFLFLFSGFAYGQQSQTEDASMRLILQDIMAKAKRYSLYKTKIEWPILEAEVFKKNDAELSTEEFQQRVKFIFKTLNDKHAGFFFQGKRIRLEDPILLNVRPPLKNAFNGKPVPLMTRMLENGYGYILVPGTSKSDKKTIQKYQDSLCRLGLSHLKGIVIDLRLNQGGSIYPMFTGFNQLFDSKTIAYTCSFDGKPQNKLSVKNGSYYSGDRKIASVSNTCKAAKDIKVAVLISQITASSGEMLAIAFKGRKNTLFIGERTAGYTTLVGEFNLGKGYLGLSSSFLSDRNGIVYDKFVEPDVLIVDGDDFENIKNDAKVEAALEWLKKE